MKRSPKRVKRGFVPPLDAGQLARLGPDGTIALAARCLLRSAPFAVENLRKKRPDAALLLARVLHAISGCGLSIATKGTARSFQSKFQLAQLASSIRSGVSTLESVVAPGGAEALTAGRLILAACKAMLEKRQNGYELAVQSITHALGVLDLDPAKVVDKGILATAQDFAFLHKAAAESHDPKKYIQRQLIRNLTIHTPLWSEPKTQPKKWARILENLESEIQMAAVEVHSAKPGRGFAAAQLWYPTGEEDEARWFAGVLLNATTEVRKGTTLQYLDNLKEIATTTPKPPIGFKSSISAGHEAGQLSRPEPQEAARPPKEIEEFVMKVMADFQEKERPKRYVSTGFARTAHPYSAIPKDNPLRPGGEYLFWLKIGKLDPHSIERTPTALPEEGLPPEAKLAIVLFSYPDELELSEAGSLGEVTLHAKGAVTVTRHAYSFPDALKGQGEMEDCVCFPVRCPAKAGKFRLRCCIYHKEVLLQSREVTALVSNDQTSAADCLVSVLDYTINQTLDLRRLAVMSPHRLSILMNGGDGDNPTHQLRFRGQGEFTSGAVIAEAALETLTSTAREAMRLVCWGSRDEWDEHKVYKYENDTLTFETDIITLARAGFRLYSDLIDTLSGGEVSKREIKQLMRHPGLVQLACRRSPRELLPISMIYDHRLDTNLPSRICPAFTDSLLQNTDLAESPCFQGNCPSDGKLDVVCPSGFWGFRHEIGLPVSLTDKKEDESGDVAVTLGSTGGPGLSVAVCLDPQFVLRNTHEKNLRGLDPDLDYCNSRAGTLDMLRTTKSPVVYFYCHGGMQGNYPYIRVGELNEAGISADNLEAYQVNWVPPGPLVFINGCKTTALQPSCAFDFVRAFIQKSHATGVIGTEITIFEPLACAFAESFLRFFVVDNCQVGNSIRRARLSLLRARNPLGLVYIPFALASIQLRARG